MLQHTHTLPHELHTKFSMIFIRVVWNPYVTPNCLSTLLSTVRSANPLILASNMEYKINEKLVYSIAVMYPLIC